MFACASVSAIPRFPFPETRSNLIMSDQQPSALPDVPATDGEPTESADEREHDCQQYLETSIWSGSTFATTLSAGNRAGHPAR